MKPSPRPRSLRTHLAALVLASTVPLLIFAGVMGLLFERQQAFYDQARRVLKANPRWLAVIEAALAAGRAA